MDGIVDSLGEDADSPVPNITHRYPDRVLFLVSPVCAAYCRFCTRRRKVGDPEKIPLGQFDAAFDYIRRAHRGPGCQPLGRRPADAVGPAGRVLPRRSSATIPHVEIVRIHTRIPSQLPERITPALCETIKKHHPVFVNVHFNHPDELTPAARAALAMLADAGCPLGSQTVLLKGVNDDPAVMKRLMQELLRCRVRPYYIYQADLVAGGEHFRTSVAKGLEIIEALRGWTSGLAVPHFVIDAPGGGGKIPLLPAVRAVRSPSGRSSCGTTRARRSATSFRSRTRARDDARLSRDPPPSTRAASARGPKSRRGEPLARLAPSTRPTGRSRRTRPGGRALRQRHPAPPELRAERLRIGPVEPGHPLAQERRGRGGSALAPRRRLEHARDRHYHPSGEHQSPASTSPPLTQPAAGEPGAPRGAEPAARRRAAGVRTSS